MTEQDSAMQEENVDIDTKQETESTAEAIASESVRDTQQRPNVWTPEDASRFLSSAIKEAQQPLVEALRRPSVPRSTFGLTMFALLVVGGVAGWMQYRHVLFVEESNRHLSIKADDGEKAKAAQLVLQEEVTRTRQENVALRSVVKDEKDRRTKFEMKTSIAVSELRGDAQRAKMAMAEYQAEITRLRKALKGAIQGQQELEMLRKRSRLLEVQLEGQEDQILALQKQLRATKGLLNGGKGELDEGEATKRPMSAAEIFHREIMRLKNRANDAQGKTGVGILGIPGNTKKGQEPAGKDVPIPDDTMRKPAPISPLDAPVPAPPARTESAEKAGNGEAGKPEAQLESDGGVESEEDIEIEEIEEETVGSDGGETTLSL